MMENKIELLNGTVLQGYTPKKVLDTHSSSSFQLDTTGQYFQIGKKPTIQKLSKSVAAREQFFYEHAFFFLANADKILADSRMFLAPVPVQSGLAYTGISGFQNPTLGIYIEWWLNNPISMLEKDGKKYLAWLIAGSPLSGCNKCGIVDEQGNDEVHTFIPFRNVWGSFVKINTRYSEAKSKYTAFTMEEVYELLQSVETEEQKKTRSYILDCYFLRSQCRMMSDQIERMQQQMYELTKENTTLKIQSREHLLEDVYERYVDYKNEQFKQMEELREHRRLLRMRLRGGELTNDTEYQQSMRNINRELKQLKHPPLPDFAKVVYEIGVTIYDVEKYFTAKKKSEEQN